MDDPSGLPAPSSAALASELIIGLVIRMENKCEGGKTVRADMPGELLARNGSIAIFLHIQSAGTERADFDHVVELAVVPGDLQAEGAQPEMLEFFGGGEAIHIFDEFLHAIARGADDLIQLAVGCGIYNGLLLIDIGRQPVGFGDGSDWCKI